MGPKSFQFHIFYRDNLFYSKPDKNIRGIHKLCWQDFEATEILTTNLFTFWFSRVGSQIRRLVAFYTDSLFCKCGPAYEPLWQIQTDVCIKRMSKYNWEEHLNVQPGLIKKFISKMTVLRKNGVHVRLDAF